MGIVNDTVADGISHWRGMNVLVWFNMLVSHTKGEITLFPARSAAVVVPLIVGSVMCLLNSGYTL